jgi:hypothetical protein
MRPGAASQVMGGSPRRWPPPPRPMVLPRDSRHRLERDHRRRARRSETRRMAAGGGRASGRQGTPAGGPRIRPRLTAASRVPAVAQQHDGGLRTVGSRRGRQAERGAEVAVPGSGARRRVARCRGQGRRGRRAGLARRRWRRPGRAGRVPRRVRAGLCRADAGAGFPDTSTASTTHAPPAGRGAARTRPRVPARSGQHAQDGRAVGAAAPRHDGERRRRTEENRMRGRARRRPSWQ